VPGTDVVVVGGGVIGLAVAWRAAGHGLAVTVVDPDPGGGSSWAAAGMLAPVTEVHYGEEALLRLNLASAQLWPAFAAELEAAPGGGRIGYRRSGTLLVAAEEGDRALAADLHAFQRELGLEAQWLTARRARELEPGLAPGIRAALWAPGDHQVDNRLLLSALRDAAEAAGARTTRATVTAVDTAGGRVTGVRLADGADVAAPCVVVAAGCGSSAIAGIPECAPLPVRPVKGQILRLRGPAGAPVLGRIVRGVVHGSSIYLVPREDGGMVVGATMEERGFDTTVTAGALYELLRDAHRVVPAVTELVLDEATARLRPGSPDNAPMVGAGGVDGLVVATGHYRNGVLLAPITADAVVGLITGGDMLEAMTPFSPGRFAPGAPGPDAGTGMPH
jgi:glycine oxidase